MSADTINPGCQNGMPDSEKDAPRAESAANPRDDTRIQNGSAEETNPKDAAEERCYAINLAQNMPLPLSPQDTLGPDDAHPHDQAMFLPAAAPKNTDYPRASPKNRHEPASKSSSPRNGELKPKGFRNRPHSPTRKRKSDQLIRGLPFPPVLESPKRTRTQSIEGGGARTQENGAITGEDHATATAAFKNGQRQTSGRGRMVNDYVGVFLPLADEFAGDGPETFRAPWLEQQDPIAYNSMSLGTDRLSLEITHFLSYMMRTADERNGRSCTMDRAMCTINNFFRKPNHLVTLYGSDATGMGLPTCDIDLMITAPSLESSNPYIVRDEKIEVLRKMQEHFSSLGISKSSNVRDTAAVPLLEITDLQSGLDIDISFDEHQAASSLAEIDHWKHIYGEPQIRELVLLLKHALGMRKLGYGTAVMPYQGGVGSYIILCMVVVYLDHLQRSSYMYHLDAPYTTVGGQFLGFLKYWGEDFDYGGMGIILEPPSIVPKTPGLPPYIFEVRRNLNGGNLAGAMFGTRHIKETLRGFFHELSSKIVDYEAWKSRRSWEACPINPALGILGSIMAGDYRQFEARREKVKSVGRIEEARRIEASRPAKYIPPHMRRPNKEQPPP